MKPLDQIKEFREKFGMSLPERPMLPPINAQIWLVRMLGEELGSELLEAIIAQDMVKIADALTDGMVVLLHTYCEYGLQDLLQPLFDEVHRSNMTKSPAPGTNTRKFNRGLNYIPPDLAKVLRVTR